MANRCARVIAARIPFVARSFLILALWAGFNPLIVPMYLPCSLRERLCAALRCGFRRARPLDEAFEAAVEVAAASNGAIRPKERASRLNECGSSEFPWQAQCSVSALVNLMTISLMNYLPLDDNRNITRDRRAHPGIAE